ncbi:MAG: tRNA lysidine(34) synthetase TilS [Phycisphaerales bacterium]|nr:tRNA lysidine(34) synthetase TilS [Planctomycetota bacterium]
MDSATRTTLSHHPTVHRVVSAWRTLSGGNEVRDQDRRTLVACSGGGDSSALVLALAGPSVVVGHVVHDMRPPEESARCSGTARELAESLGLPFYQVSIAARQVGGNYEATARKLRYEALARMAAEQGCRYVATAHHAEDQLETLLLRIMRGVGPQGLGGIHARRRLAGGVVLLRPMLAVSRAEGLALCRAMGVVWSEDTSNLDTTRRRAAVRSRVLPALLEIEPGVAAKAVECASLGRRTALHLNREAERLKARAASAQGAGVFDREILRSSDAIVLLTLLRRLGPGAPQRALVAAARWIRSRSGERKEFKLGGTSLLCERGVVRSSRGTDSASKPVEK